MAINDFPLQALDKIRYTDTDRQGHVNNSVFASFLETGRVECLYNHDIPIIRQGANFVIASLKLEFMNEIHWPGDVVIGTGVFRVGNSSITLYQELYQDDRIVGKAETVIVQVSEATKKSMELTEGAKDYFRKMLLNKEDYSLRQ